MSAASAAAIRDGLGRLRWSTTDLWRAALGVGGAFSTGDVEALASGERDATRSEHDILASALNDHFLDWGGDHPVPYWRDLP